MASGADHQTTPEASLQLYYPQIGKHAAGMQKWSLYILSGVCIGISDQLRHGSEFIRSQFLRCHRKLSLQPFDCIAKTPIGVILDHKSLLLRQFRFPASASDQLFQVLHVIVLDVFKQCILGAVMKRPDMTPWFTAPWEA